MRKFFCGCVLALAWTGVATAAGVDDIKSFSRAMNNMARGSVILPAIRFTRFEVVEDGRGVTFYANFDLFRDHLESFSLEQRVARVPDGARHTLKLSFRTDADLLAEVRGGARFALTLPRIEPSDDVEEAFIAAVLDSLHFMSTVNDVAAFFAGVDKAANAMILALNVPAIESAVRAQTPMPEILLPLASWVGQVSRSLAENVRPNGHYKVHVASPPSLPGKPGDILFEGKNASEVTITLATDLKGPKAYSREAFRLLWLDSFIQAFNDKNIPTVTRRIEELAVDYTSSVRKQSPSGEACFPLMETVAGVRETALLALRQELSGLRLFQP